MTYELEMKKKIEVKEKVEFSLGCVRGNVCVFASTKAGSYYLVSFTPEGTLNRSRNISHGTPFQLDEKCRIIETL